MARLVRYFCTVGPKGDEWSDVAYEYLHALVLANITVRVLPIGGGMLSFPDDEFKHWRFHASWFTGAFADNFVNVVCTPPGQIQGQPIRASDIAPTRVVGVSGGEVPPQILAAGAGASNDIIYEPAYALTQLWTVGHRNIAITGVTPEPPSEAECDALRRYDAVICPTKRDAEALRLVGVSAAHYSAVALHRDANSLPIFLGEPR